MRAQVLLLKDKQWLSGVGRTGEPRAVGGGLALMEYSHRKCDRAPHTPAAWTRGAPSSQMRNWGLARKMASISFSAEACDRKGL